MSLRVSFLHPRKDLRRDARASETVMQHIAALLPPGLRGAYGGGQEDTA